MTCPKQPTNNRSIIPSGTSAYWKSREVPSSKVTSVLIINPHQRCRYSDLPFARKDTFLYCRVQKGVDSGGTRKKKQLNFQAMIKSAASAASPKTKIQESPPQGEPSRFRCPPAESLSAGSPGFLDFGFRGGCASSRLDHGLKV